METVKKDGKWVLLGCDEAPKEVKERGRGEALPRPDIVHHCVLPLLDSPLNKAGEMRIYIETTERSVIEVNSRARIPRTFSRFSGLIVQLFRRKKVVAKESGEILLLLVKGPSQKLLPKDALCVGLSQGGT